MRRILVLLVALGGLGLLGCGAEGAASEDCDPLTCTGCCTENGTCVDGNSLLECGSSGQLCQTCTGEQVCAIDGCEVPPACTPENCTGCCDGDECITTPGLNNACGTGGNQCQDCNVAGGTCDGTSCVSACGPSNCSGCCNNGVCVEAEDIADSACGMGGMACDDCTGSGEVCKSGVCTAPSCANTCDGCCDGETCIETAADDECGLNGAACQDCTQSDASCSFGQCIDNTCQATCGGGCCNQAGCQGGNTKSACGNGAEACITCGDNEVCDDGECVIGPDSMWDITLVSVEVPLYDSDGDTWDSFGGLPDPYMVVIPGEGTDDEVMYSTSSQAGSNSLTAEFTDAVLEGVPARAIFENLVFRCYDKDSTSPDDFIYGARTSVPPSFFNGNLLVVGSTCKFRFRLHPADQ